MCSHGSRRRFAPPHHEGLRDRPASSLRSALFARVWKDVPRTRFLVLATPCVRVLQSTFAPENGEGARDPQERTQGMPGVRCTRGSVQKMHRGSRHRFTGFNRHSLRDGFTVSFALSRVTGLSCHPRRRVRLRANIANLTPASGRQDHTTSPYASRAVRPRAKARDGVAGVHRIPSRVNDDHDTPLFRGGTSCKGN